jgi:hypothetical protein
VETATTLGLTVFDDQIAMAFLPSGKVLPEEKQTAWNALKADIETAPAPATKAEMRKLLQAMLKNVLEKHGLKLKKLPRYEGADVDFVRPVPGGTQRIGVTIKGYAPDFECYVDCGGDNDLMEQVMRNALGDDAPFGNTMQNSYAFSLANFVTRMDEFVKCSTRQEIEQAMTLLETKALQALDIARDLKGIDMLANDEAFVKDKFPAPYRVGFVNDCNAVVIAGLVGNPRFDEIATRFLTFYEHKPFWVTHLSRLRKLVPYVREHVKPVV